MDMRRNVALLCAVTLIMVMLSMQSACGKTEEHSLGVSLGQLQMFQKDRHLLALDCGAACGKRCSAAGIKKRCLKYCGICCSKCQCVPPGTFGNKDKCPCYRDLKTNNGTPKCP